MSHSILDYGADPTGQSDSSQAFRDTFADAGSFSEVIIPPGSYRCESPIIVHATGLTVKGIGVGSHIFFRGEFDDGLRFEDSSFLTIRDLHLSGPSSVGRGLHVTLSELSRSAQHIHIENIFGEGFGSAFAVGADTHGDVSETNFYSCVGVGSSVAAFILGDNVPANVLDIRFYGCRASNGKVGVLARGTGFSWHGGTTLGNTEADFRQLASSSSPVLIESVRSEHSRRFWDSPDTAGYGVTVMIQSVFVAAFSDPDGIVLNHFSSSPLTMMNATFAGGPVPARFVLGFSKDYCLPVVAIQIVTDNDDPFGPNNPNRIITRIGCHKLDPETWTINAH